MWYAGYGYNGYWRIGYASSTDGVNWIDNSNNPIIDESLINENVTEPTLSFDSGAYKMWYVSVNKQNNQSKIKYRTSIDGINWSIPITVLIRAQAWENNYLAHPEIITVNNEYKLFYTGDSGGAWRIGYATSTNGINWNKYQNNPIFIPSLSEVPTVGGSSILYGSGKYIMYYHSNHPPTKFNYATSTDGNNWTRSIDNPIMTTSSTGFDRNMIASPMIIKDGNLYKMWYAGSEGGRWRIGYATASADLTTLDVPLLKQTDINWKDQEYDSASFWGGLRTTIGDWGCAITSAAMVLKFHGINKLPDETVLDPGTLNAWLKNQKDGYVGDGLTNWLAISRLSKLAKEVNNITQFDALEFSRINEADKAQLTKDLEKSQPGILEEPGHFIVAKGANGDTFDINDPYYNRNTLNDSYSNTFLSLNRFIPSNTNLSYIMIVTTPDIQITLKNSLGNEIGDQFIQEPLINDATGQTGGSARRIFYVQKPPSGNYQLIISAPTTQEYKINIYFYDQNGNVNVSEQTGITGLNLDQEILNFDQTNSNNSRAQKVATFQSTIDDIRELQILKLIKDKTLVETIINYIRLTEKITAINKRAALAQLNHLEKIIKMSKEKLMEEEAFQIILYDITYLKNHL